MSEPTTNGDGAGILAERDALRARIAKLEVIVAHYERDDNQLEHLRFERDCLQSAVYVLSNGRYCDVDRELWDFIAAHGEPMEDVMARLELRWASRGSATPAASTA